MDFVLVPEETIISNMVDFFCRKNPKVLEDINSVFKHKFIFTIDNIHDTMYHLGNEIDDYMDIIIEVLENNGISDDDFFEIFEKYQFTNSNKNCIDIYLDDMLECDAFGTEGQCDPRGDQRNSNTTSINKMSNDQVLELLKRLLETNPYEFFELALLD